MLFQHRQLGVASPTNKPTIGVRAQGFSGGGLWLMQPNAPFSDATGQNQLATIAVAGSFGGGLIGPQWNNGELDIANGAAIQDMALSNTSGLTTWAWINPTALTTGNIWDKSDANTVNRGLGFEFLNSGTLRITVIRSSIDDTYVMNGTLLGTSNRWYHVAFTWDGTVGASARIAFYLNGVPTAGTVGAGSGTQASDSGFPLRIGKGFRGQIAGGVALVGIDRREYSAAEATALYSDPWRNLTPYSMRSRGVASPVTVAPGVGSIVFTGQAPTTTTNAAVSPAAGSLVFTGFAPTVTTNSVVAPGVGSIVLTGLAPTTTIDAAVAPGVGSVVFSGFAPTITSNAVVSPGVGAIVLTGFAPTATINATVAPAAGSIVFSGFAPTVTNLGGMFFRSFP